MKKLIVANWKMQPNTLADAQKLFDSVLKTAKKLKNVETVLCPPFGEYLSVI
jgi:triosephosphate isomerase